MKDKCLRVLSLSNVLLRYTRSLELQEALVQSRRAGTVPDTLLILQHHPVFTVGKRGTEQDFHTSPEELQRLGIDVAHVPRGGETTYHGPGQLLAYPILGLRGLGLGARAFVEGLEDAMAHTAGCFGIQARGRVPGKTGVWVGDRKLGAVGVRISHGVSSHGIALNVVTDLTAYAHIVPCGTPDKEVTSLRRELALAAAGGGGARARRKADRATAAPGEAMQTAAAAAAGLVGDPELLALAERCLVDSVARCFGLRAVPAEDGEVRSMLLQACR